MRNADKSGPLRIIQIGMHQRGAAGGADRFFWDLFDNLKLSTDFSLRAFYFRQPGIKPDTAPDEVCLGPSDLPVYQRLWNLRRAVAPGFKSEHDRAHLLVSHFALYASALLPKLSRLPHVIHFQGPWSTESAVEGKGRLNVAVKHLVEQAVYSSADAFITLSHSFREILIKRYFIDPARIHVIPPAVDLERFRMGDRQEARQRMELPNDAVILICVRRLARRMGLEVLVEAFRQVADTHPRSLLLLGGTGALRDELAGIVDGYGLKNRIRLLGFIPDEQLTMAYQAADLSIVPSQALEGFGLTTLESLACGTPVLVTPVGGLPEAVSSLTSQLVLADGGSASMAEWLDRFLNGKITLPSAEECRRYVEANFAWSIIAERVRVLYWQVVRGEMLVARPPDHDGSLERAR